MSKLDSIFDAIQNSAPAQELRTRYDELDSQTKLYINLGALGGAALMVFLVIVVGIARVNGLKSDLNEREEMIGYLNVSADHIRSQRALQQQRQGADPSASLPGFVDSVLSTAGIAKETIEIGGETPGAEDKDSKEMLINVKFTQSNLRQLTRFLFTATDLGSPYGLNIKDLNIDTKSDPAGYMDATVTLAAYRAK